MLLLVVADMLSSKVNDFGSVSPDCFPMSVTLTRCYSSSRSMLLPTGPPPWDTHNSVVYSVARNCRTQVKTSKTLGSVWFKLYLNKNRSKHVHVYFASSGNHPVVMCRTTVVPLHSCDKWIKISKIQNKLCLNRDNFDLNRTCWSSSCYFLL